MYHDFLYQRSHRRILLYSKMFYPVGLILLPPCDVLLYDFILVCSSYLQCHMLLLLLVTIYIHPQEFPVSFDLYAQKVDKLFWINQSHKLWGVFIFDWNRCFTRESIPLRQGWSSLRQIRLEGMSLDLIQSSQ